MKPEIKQQWITALRSGKYKQGRNCLRSLDEQFCCLGVLCHLKEPLGWMPAVDRSSYAIGECDNVSTPPQPTMKWADMKSFCVPGLLARESPNNDIEVPISLMTLNDDARLTFDQIADVIQYFY